MDKEKDKEFLKKINEIFSDPEIYKYINCGFPEFPKTEETSEYLFFTLNNLWYIFYDGPYVLINGKELDPMSHLCRLNDEPTEREFWEEYSESINCRWNDFKPLMKIKKVSELFDKMISGFHISEVKYLDILIESYFRTKKKYTLDDNYINICLKDFLIGNGNYYRGNGIYKLFSEALIRDFEYPQVIDGIENAFNKLMHELEKLPRGYYMLGRDVSFGVEESKLKDFYNKYWCDNEFDSYEEFVKTFKEDPNSFNDAVEVCKRRLKHEMALERKHEEDLNYIKRNNDLIEDFWYFYLPKIENFVPSNLFASKSLFDKVKIECSSYKYDLDTIVDMCIRVYDRLSTYKFIDENSFDLCDNINSFIVNNREIINPLTIVQDNLSLETQNDFTNVIQNSLYYELYVASHKNKKSKINEGSKLVTNESGSKGRR